MYGSYVDIQHNIKDLYLGLTLLLAIIIVPKWNYIVGWESYLFIPHITKVFFISILLIIAATFFLNRAILRRSSSRHFLINSFKVIAFVLITFSIYKWNAVVAKWVEDSIWYIPHITKIYILCIIGASFIYRGIYFPIKNKIHASGVNKSHSILKCGTCPISHARWVGEAPEACEATSAHFGFVLRIVGEFVFHVEAAVDVAPILEEGAPVLLQRRVYLKFEK